MNLKLQAYPFVRVLIPLILGFILRFSIFPQNHLSTTNFIFIVAGAIVTLVYPIKYSFNSRWLSGATIFIVMFVIGFQLKPAFLKQQKPIKENEIFYASVNKIVKSDQHQHVVLMKCHFINDTNNLPFQLLLRHQKKSEEHALYPGNEYLIKAKIDEVKPPTNPYVFSYKKYLQSIDVIGIISKSDIKYLGRKFNFRYYFERLRHWAEAKIKQCDFGEEEFGILTALSLGDKSFLNNEVKLNFVNSGAIHILSVSGLHVGIVYLMLLNAFKFLDKAKLKRIKILIILLSMWFYAAITGLSPSVTRSTIMFTVFLLSKLRKNDYNIYHSLAIAGFLILIVDPYAFISPGFWLSFTAVASIVYFYPIINNLIYFNKPYYRYIWSLIAVSLSVQIGTAPLTIYLFGFFPIYFLVSNLLLIPILPFVLISVLLMLILPINSFLFKILSGIASDGGTYIYNITKWIGGLKNARFCKIQIDEYLLLVISIITILYILYRERKRLLFLMLMLSFSLVLIISIAYKRILNINNSTFVVHDVSKKTMLTIVTSKEKYCIKSNELEEKTISNVLNPLISKNGLSEISFKKICNKTISSFLIGDKTGLIINGCIENRNTIEELNDVDYIVFTKNASEAFIEKCINKQQNKQFIYDSSWGYYKSNNQKNKFVNNKNRIHFVNISGAFVVENK